jgi:hypothetical protein
VPMAFDVRTPSCQIWGVLTREGSYMRPRLGVSVPRGSECIPMGSEEMVPWCKIWLLRGDGHAWRAVSKWAKKE